MSKTRPRALPFYLETFFRCVQLETTETTAKSLSNDLRTNVLTEYFHTTDPKVYSDFLYELYVKDANQQILFHSLIGLRNERDRFKLETAEGFLKLAEIIVLVVEKTAAPPLFVFKDPKEIDAQLPVIHALRTAGNLLAAIVAKNLKMNKDTESQVKLLKNKITALIMFHKRNNLNHSTVKIGSTAAVVPLLSKQQDNQPLSVSSQPPAQSKAEGMSDAPQGILKNQVHISVSKCASSTFQNNHHAKREEIPLISNCDVKITISA